MKSLPKLLLLITLLAFIVVLVFVNPIAQPLTYHDFCDNETYFGLSNFYNVLSNIGFLLLGFYGLFIVSKYKISSLFPIVISIGFILTSIGSSYYHYNPNNETLVWDRLPMTIVFTTFFAQAYSWLVNKKQALFIWKISLILGLFSVWYWYYTESIGKGDLRLYALVQYLPMLLLIIIITLKKSQNKILVRCFIMMGLYYLIAKVFENFDCQFHNIFNVVGGHPLKHIAASMAAYYIIKSIKIKHEVQLSKKHVAQHDSSY